MYFQKCVIFYGILKNIIQNMYFIASSIVTSFILYIKLLNISKINYINDIFIDIKILRFIKNKNILEKTYFY
jgi:hypothetical protein